MKNANMRSIRYETYILTSPLFIILGILLAVNHIISLPQAIVSLLIAVLLLHRVHPAVSALLVECLISMVAGYVVMQNSITTARHDNISKSMFCPVLDGSIAEIHYSSKWTRIIMEPATKCGNVALGYIQLFTRKRLIAYPKDIVVLHSVKLEPPQGAQAVYGYNFAMDDYFRKISASGFIFGHMDIIESHRTWLQVLKQKIIYHIKHIMDERGAALFMAIVLGDKSYLSEDILSDLRNAGLSHMMAVSGFHMSTLVGFVFTVLSVLQLIIIKLLRKQHWIIYQRDIAAILCAILGCIYLIIVDIPISAKRAYIMLMFFLFAILSRRISSSKYNIAIAADIILLSTPEALFSPSFQMSFMATLAIISLYQYKNYDFFSHQFTDSNWMSNTINYVKMNFASSLVATIATLPQTIYYFHTFTTMGIISNVIVTPILTVITIPIFTLSAIVPYAGHLLNYATSVITIVATYVASLKHSVIHVKQIPFIALMTFNISIVTVCSKHYKALGIPLLFLGLVFSYAYPPSDIFVGLSNDKVLLAFHDGRELKTNNRVNSILREWSKQWGAAHLNNIKEISQINGKTVTVYDDKVTIGDDIVVTKENLRKYGTHQIWLRDGYNVMRYNGMPTR